VGLEAGAAPGAERCPACGEPLFVWLETEGWGPREDQIVDRCENCGLVAPRGGASTPEAAVAELLGAAPGRSNGGGGGEIVVRAANAASLQAWLGAENWAALRPGTSALKPTPRAVELLCERRGLRLTRIRHLAQPGIAAMWQTLLNLLTFHRDFATEAVSGRLRPQTGRGRAAYAIDAIVTVLAAIPTAILAAIFEGAAVLARRGGVIEIRARRER
jgi:hypothetical protein